MIYVPESSSYLLKFITNNNFIKCPDIIFFKVSCHPNSVYTIKSDDIVHIFTKNAHMVSKGMIFTLKDNLSLVVRRQSYKLKKQRSTNMPGIHIVEKDDIVVYVSDIMLDGSIKGTYIYSDNCLVNGLVSNLTNNFQKYYRVKKSTSYEKDLFYLLRLAKII
ncbi:hypothetical protein VCUG_02390 [Vavraia culicis subsp. floridensis]|uniref:Uncharacterized protein n=1 Tax=Vavraia culicis (isolate floridensis) TaxID=948595 RepID=L2GRW4_VAVCU|nr:uncharacterized protein VCUG_02390 [Vavraia culicis subsp. floridensis]ELA46127.1 hypothetical protein VCUG_02390 [Vavraia culicis subsp. floridensis]